ncbi:MAG TPA: GTPase ObgE [Solirubrobacteraceae bacterium]|jgi:GTP-binding protein
MLYDHVRIHVQAGQGGDGSASFRREAHVPRGGPDGGDGGRGGDVLVSCDESLRDLQSFRRRSRYAAGRGGHGGGSQRHGADGENLAIKVPPGTLISGEEEDLEGRRYELLADGQSVVVACGGSGGRGNKRFATATRQAPRFAERGLPGEQGWLDLRLKLLADIGLVGLPNAGKSSLLARLTRAAPKVASYPFTTLEPILGVLEGEERQLVIADIPGLIEGASSGAGLGHEFLAHIERTRLLVHVVDIAPELSGPEHADPVDNYEIIERELAAHDERLSSLDRVLVLSKADLLTAEQVSSRVGEWSSRLGADIPVLATSAATGAGVAELAQELLRRVPAHAAQGSAGPDEGAQARVQDLVEHMVYRPVAHEGFTVEQTAPGRFAVRGRGVERLLARYDIDNEDAMSYFEGRLRRIGVLGALEAKGFQTGDEIEIAGVVFELDPGVPS